MVKIVQIPPLTVARLQRIRLIVRVVENLRKAAEKLGHSYIRLRVTNIPGGVYEPRPSVRASDCVSAPQVTVQKRRWPLWAKPKVLIFAVVSTGSTTTPTKPKLGISPRVLRSKISATLEQSSKVHFHPDKKMRNQIAEKALNL